MQRIIGLLPLLVVCCLGLCPLTVALPKISNDDAHLPQPGEPAYYYLADADTSHVGPNDELRRTHRSLWKKLFKDTGLEGLFNDCNGCCNNCNNYAQGGGYDGPPPTDYNAPFQPFQGLEPLKPWKGLFDSFGFKNKNNGLNFGNYGSDYNNNYDNSYGAAEDGYNKYTQPQQQQQGAGGGYNGGEENKYGSNDAPNESYDNQQNSNNYNKPNAPAYEQPKEEPSYGTQTNTNNYKAPAAGGNSYEKAPAYGKQTQGDDKYAGAAGGGYANADSAAGNGYDYAKLPQIVYQPIIYVSPQYRPGKGAGGYSKHGHDADSSEEKDSHESHTPVAYEAPVPNKAETQSSNYEGTAPQYGEQQAPPAVTQYGEQQAPPAVTQYGEQQAQPQPPPMPTYSYTPTITPVDIPCTYDTPMSPSTYNNMHHGYGNNNYGATPSGVTTVSAMYTIVTPPVTTTNGGYAEPMHTAYGPTMHMRPAPMPAAAYSPPVPLKLSLADQPYRVCPELFTEYQLQLNGYGQHATRY